MVAYNFRNFILKKIKLLTCLCLLLSLSLVFCLGAANAQFGPEVLKHKNWQNKKYDVIAVDNAIYDVFEFINESELEKIIEPLRIKRGEMTLISKEQFYKLNSPAKTYIEYAGGSSANTLAFLASAGMKTIFIGTVSNDKEGNKFIQSLKKAGVEFAGFKKNLPDPTGQSHIFITEDGKRTMLTLLGSSDNFSPNDIDLSLLADTKIFFSQAYIIGNKERNNLLKSMLIKTKDNGGINILGLSSAFIVKKKLNALLNLIPYIDVIIGNHLEFESLYKTDTLDEVLTMASSNNKLNIITLGEKGAYIIYKNKKILVPAHKVDVIDTTGAGDTFAGGFIYGILNNMPLKECGAIGAYAAADVVQKIGARLEKPEAIALAKISK